MCGYCSVCVFRLLNSLLVLGLPLASLHNWRQLPALQELHEGGTTCPYRSHRDQKNDEDEDKAKAAATQLGVEDIMLLEARLPMFIISLLLFQASSFFLQGFVFVFLFFFFPLLFVSSSSSSFPLSLVIFLLLVLHSSFSSFLLFVFGSCLRVLRKNNLYGV